MEKSATLRINARLTKRVFMILNRDVIKIIISKIIDIMCVKMKLEYFVQMLPVKIKLNAKQGKAVQMKILNQVVIKISNT